MTREEAIKVLRTESIELGGSAASVCRFWEALDMAISALRQQETVAKCNDLFDEDGGDIYQENDSICSSTNLPCCRCNPGPCDHRQEPVTNRNGLNEPLTNAQKIRAMSDMELAQWMASRIANLKFLDIEMSGKQLTATEKAALTHDLYVVFGRYLQQPAEEDDHA